MTAPSFRSADRAGSIDSGIPSRISDSAPMNGSAHQRRDLRRREAAEAAQARGLALGDLGEQDGTSHPCTRAPLAATSASDQPAAIISWRIRT